MLGTAFGLELSISNINEFLLQKIQKKLGFWTAQHLSLAARSVVINSVPHCISSSACEAALHMFSRKSNPRSVTFFGLANPTPAELV